MDWCRLSSSYYLDPAVVGAGEAAEVLFTRLLAYCAEKETRGRVPKSVLPYLAPTKTKQRTDALLRENVLLDDGTHVVLRSWERWQEAHDSLAEKRRKEREKKARQRAAKRDTSPGQEGGQLGGQDGGQSPGRPGCIEVEVEEEKPKSKPSSADADFDEFWKLYPRKTAKAAAVKAWRRARKAATVEEILTGVERYAKERAGQDPKYTAHPATWLNDARWDDDPESELSPDGFRLPPPGTDPHDEWMFE